MKYRYDALAIFIANLMDSALDRDEILSQAHALEEDCKRLGIEIKGKPIRQLLEEVKQKENSE